MFSNEKAEIYSPYHPDPLAVLPKTTDLCIGAHQDDLEIMAYGPISQCYNDPDRFFSGVVVTDGATSPRSGAYADFTNDNMRNIRIIEQKNAAHIGRYLTQTFLSYENEPVKDPTTRRLTDELKNIILTASPKNLYTHNLADKHDTHVAVALHVIRALREIPQEKRPKKIIAMEVWRSLDWLCDEDKVVHDTGAYPNISTALVGIYDSQVSGGKRYDLAIQGRRLANATFFAAHDVDDYHSAEYGLDITDLVNSNACPADFIGKYIDKFKTDVVSRIERLS